MLRLLTQSPCTEHEYHHISSFASKDMNIWHAWRQSLSLQQPPRSPLRISHTRAVCSAAPGAACLGRAVWALWLALPVSVVEHLMLVLVLSPAGTQSCCFSWVQGIISQLEATVQPHPLRGSLATQQGVLKQWPGRSLDSSKVCSSEWTRLCHHYTWECQFICWHRLNPKLHHLHSLIFSRFSLDSSCPHSASDSHWQTKFKALFSVRGSVTPRSSQNYSLLLPLSNISLSAPVGSTLVGLFLLLDLTFFTSYFFFPCWPPCLFYTFYSPCFYHHWCVAWLSISPKALPSLWTAPPESLTAPPAYRVGKLLLHPSLKPAAHFCEGHHYSFPHRGSNPWRYLVF